MGYSYFGFPKAKAGIRAALVRTQGLQDPFQALRGNSMIKKCIKDCIAHMKATGNNWAQSTLNVTTPPVGKRILKSSSPGYDEQCNTKRVLPDEDWARKVYAPVVQVEQANFINVFVGCFCNIEMRMVLSGKVYVMGLPYEVVPGRQMNEKRAAIYSMSPPELDSLIRARGWVCEVAQDSAICMPSGVLIASACEEPAHYVKWAVASDDSDLRRVQYMVTQMLEVSPELRPPQHGYTPYLSWINAQLGEGGH